mmetsp:Transcript_13358/g.21959  ORF Transcript_13358/g.21959 Transcript_13358/m.21959 type:complete len:155 (+) Transcript_13358:111-575(+)
MGNTQCQPIECTGACHPDGNFENVDTKDPDALKYGHFDERSYSARPDGMAIIVQGDGRKRLKAVTVTLRRTGPQWRHIGLTVIQDEKRPALFIEEIVTPSLMSEWNEANAHIAANIVQVGDTITSVNGVSSSAAEMVESLAECQKDAVVELVIA